MDKTSKSILRFIIRSLMIISMGAIITVVWYIVADPFKVLHHYDSYFINPDEQTARIGLNKGMVTLNNFTDRLKEGYQYDSFIFGSSISCYYDATKWASLIEDAKDPAIAEGGEVAIHPYHFDSSGETLMSMARKVKFLDRKGISIRHALIVLDPIILTYETSDDPAYLDPPQLHRSFLETIKYHYTFFRAAVNADFLKSYLPSLIMSRPIDNGRNRIFESQPIIYDPVTNQETIPQWDSLIRSDSKSFYANHPLKPSPESFSEGKQTLRGERLRALESISDVFRHHSTDCKIIIGPNRLKVTLHPEDLSILQNLFHADCVHDFSASHAHLLEADTMLYDNTHYRPPMAEIMMRDAYLK